LTPPSQAAHTLQSAHGDHAHGAFDWARFKAHQTADPAVKGYVRATAHYATGHSIVRLLGEVGAAPPKALVDCARSLDKVYMPARYPDAYDAGAPMDYYTSAGADAALDCALHPGLAR
jgi:HEPN domain-containing protein